jgi:hypothetical protein
MLLRYTKRDTALALLQSFLRNVASVELIIRVDPTDNHYGWALRWCCAFLKNTRLLGWWSLNLPVSASTAMSHTSPGVFPSSSEGPSSTPSEVPFDKCVHAVGFPGIVTSRELLDLNLGIVVDYDAICCLYCEPKDRMFTPSKVREHVKGHKTGLKRDQNNAYFDSLLFRYNIRLDQVNHECCHARSYHADALLAERYRSSHMAHGAATVPPCLRCLQVSPL